MTPSFAFTHPQPKESWALLRERLSQLEAALLDARGRMLMSFDRELASLRGWMDSIEHFDPTTGLQTLADAARLRSDESFEDLMAAPPPFLPSNVVPFTASASGVGNAVAMELPPLEEQPLDPHLANATIEELNAALAAAFEHMSETYPFSEPDPRPA